MKKKPELLAPAGSFEAMKASVNAGADAVYMGGKMFGARAFAQNCDERELIEAIEYCHLRGRKLYLTVNTLLKDSEIGEELYGFLLPFYMAGLDAVIVQDIGAMDFIAGNFPGLDIHVSTQCSVTMAKGIEGITSLLQNPRAVTRVVPSRELSIEELKLLRKETGLELEVFVHGAVCYCYSGQCLLSSLAAGRSGNRGRCAQPCRKKYRTVIDGKEYSGYILSTKDMCTLESIPYLIEAGIDSFKIEGRMKSPEYAAGVVAAYRSVIDAYFEEEKRERTDFGTDELKELYNRGGFSGSYLFTRNGQDMMSTLRPNHFGLPVGNVYRTSGRKAVIGLSAETLPGDVLELRDGNQESIYEFTCKNRTEKGGMIEILTMKEKLPKTGMQVYRVRNSTLLKTIREKYCDNELKIPVQVCVRAFHGKPLTLLLRTCDNRNIEAFAEGGTVSLAVNAGTDIKKQVCKLGNTPFFAAETEIESDKDVFVPVSELNRIRRNVSEILEEKILSLYRRNLQDAGSAFNKEYGLVSCGTEDEGKRILGVCATVSKTEQLKALSEADRTGMVSDIYYEYTSDAEEVEEVLSICSGHGYNIYFALPYIMRAGLYDKIRTLCLRLKDRAGFIARNFEEIALLNEIGAEYRTDHSIYVFNRYSEKRISVIKGKSGEPLKRGYTLPLELNYSELKNLGGKEAELIVYGLIPVMISAQCVYKTVTGRCSPHGAVVIKDEKGYAFTDIADCRICQNKIYNCAVLNLLHRMDEIKKLDPCRIRLQFTCEDGAETALVLRCFAVCLDGGKYCFPDEIMGLKMTNGHFMRGVE